MIIVSFLGTNLLVCTLLNLCYQLLLLIPEFCLLLLLFLRLYLYLLKDCKYISNRIYIHTKLKEGL